jgi:hypothetical protein
MAARSTIVSLAAARDGRNRMPDVSEEPVSSLDTKPPAKSNQPDSKKKTYSVAASQPVEPEDAYLTGVSRSLQRRLLGLNMERAREQTPAEKPAKSAKREKK